MTEIPVIIIDRRRTTEPVLEMQRRIDNLDKSIDVLLSGDARDCLIIRRWMLAAEMKRRKN